MLVEIGIISNELFANIYLFYSPSVTGENSLKYNYTRLYINTDMKHSEDYNFNSIYSKLYIFMWPITIKLCRLLVDYESWTQGELVNSLTKIYSLDQGLAYVSYCGVRKIMMDYLIGLYNPWITQTGKSYNHIYCNISIK
jgi:hypothetical protein